MFVNFEVCRSNLQKFEHFLATAVFNPILHEVFDQRILHRGLFVFYILQRILSI